MTRCSVDFNFPPTISLGWSPSGVLRYDSLPWEKMFRDDLMDAERNTVAKDLSDLLKSER